MAKLTKKKKKEKENVHTHLQNNGVWSPVPVTFELEASFFKFEERGLHQYLLPHNFD